MISCSETVNLRAEPATSDSGQTVVLEVQGMKCAGCVGTVERLLKKQPQVRAAAVNLITATALVSYTGELETPKAIADYLTQKGFPTCIRGQSAPESLPVMAVTAGTYGELLVALVLLTLSSLGHLHHWTGLSWPWLHSLKFHWFLATLALLIPGRAIFREGLLSLIRGYPNMNSLVAIGTGSAYGASCLALLFPAWGWECFFDEPVMLLGFILLGRTLEGRARRQAGEALGQLMTLRPPVARLVSTPQNLGGESFILPIEQVRTGDYLLILPAEKIPTDGKVLQGTSTVEEALVTGESTPIVKQPGELVLAGTLNQGGVLVVEATQVGTDTVLAQIIESVQEAQIRKAPIQRLADTIAGYFTYGVLALATLTGLVWIVGGRSGLIPLSSGEQLASPELMAIQFAIAVLVVACPCALGLATPTAILVGTGVGAKRGLLIKGGDVLEKTQQLTAIAFDKTGTLTWGEPQISHYFPQPGLDPQELLRVAATLEQGTHHPFAAAILAAAQEQKLTLEPVELFQTEPGWGVKAILADASETQLLIGNEAWLSQHQIPVIPPPEDLPAYCSLLYLARQQTFLGSIALQDPLRPNADATLQTLQGWGLKTILLTGDHSTVAQAIAEQLSFNSIYAQVRPQQKAQIIKDWQDQGEIVAMVGDGINDAPALAQANIGISLKGATDVALDTADIVLMRSHLEDIVAALELSRATVTKIRQNLLWALSYNLIAIPMAAGVFWSSGHLYLSPGLAAACMAASSLLVVSNSLGLYRFRPSEVVSQ